MSKNKKKSSQNNKNVNKKKKVKKAPIIIAIVTAVIIAAIIVVVSVNPFSFMSKTSQLTNCRWTASSAVNSSGDEVELSEVYNTKYSTYKRALEFKDDCTFLLWLSPGDPDDGTHSGQYTVKDDSTVDVVFDEGTVTSFKLERNNDEIQYVVVSYDNYEVYFKKE